ncbi:MAG: copper-binding protein [Rhodospirillaceae bacterium]|mgnify:CR=1 FL=1|nr:copper-binding protein [Rhodospirillaceae bacterium]
MPSKSKLIVLSLILGTAVVLAVPASAGGQEISVTAKQKKICVQAKKRYDKLYPDAKKGGTVTVKLYKYTFCPLNLTVKKGTTVRWVNVDKRTSHSVWMKEANINESDRFFPEEIWQHTFTESGAYPYLCGPHWKEQDMRGFVKVTE